MDIHFPRIREHLLSEKNVHLCGFTPDMFFSGVLGKVPKHAHRYATSMPLWADMKKALTAPDLECFLFDSGNDNAADEIEAFRDTAIEMREAGLFHLPHRTVWIEDYFAANPDRRVYYLCTENDDQIRVWAVQDDRGLLGGALLAQGIFVTHPDRKGLSAEAYGRGGVSSDDPMQVEVIEMYKQRVSWATLMLHKFIVTLGASNTVRERGETVRRTVRPGRDPMSRRERDFRTVVYGFTHVAPPSDETVSVGDGEARPRKRHLVRGYVWGRHTRPKEEQRWIAPFWRGRGEAEAQRDHYEVKASC